MAHEVPSIRLGCRSLHGCTSANTHNEYLIDREQSAILLLGARTFGIIYLQRSGSFGNLGQDLVHFSQQSKGLLRTSPAEGYDL